MAKPHENALAICLATYSQLYRLLGIENQIKKYERIKLDTDGLVQSAVIEDTFHILDILGTVKIMVTNDGSNNFIKITLAGKEFKSFEVKNNVEESVPDFATIISPLLQPMLEHINALR